MSGYNSNTNNIKNNSINDISKNRKRNTTDKKNVIQEISIKLLSSVRTIST